MTMQSDQTERLIASTTVDLEKASETVNAFLEVFEAKRAEERKFSGAVAKARRLHINELGAGDFGTRKESNLFEKLESANDNFKIAQDATCEAFKAYRWEVRRAQILHSNLRYLNVNLNKLRAKGLAS